MRIQDKPLCCRPYEKFEQYGEGSLTDIELLAMLIRTGTKDCNAEELAAHILCIHDKEPSLVSLYQTTFEELCVIKGIGKVKALQILALLELCKRITRQKHASFLSVSSPQTISRFFMEDMRHLKEESFVVTMLDAKCKMLGYKEVSRGSLTSSIVHPREVYKVAVQKSAYSIIVIHNHPSGDPTPSKEDIQITKRLKEAGDMMGIPLLDHIIIGDGVYKSLKEESYI